MEDYYSWRHRCPFVNTCSISARSGLTPTPTPTHPNPATTPQVWAVLLQHVVLSHVRLLWQMEIKWALKHAGAMVCLCFASLEISRHALCALQRDDKLKRAIQSWAVQRTQVQTQGIAGVFFSTTQSPDQGPGVLGHRSKRKENERKEGEVIKREGMFVVTPSCVNYVE